MLDADGWKHQINVKNIQDGVLFVRDYDVYSYVLRHEERLVLIFIFQRPL